MRAEDPIVTDFGASTGQNVLKETIQKFDSRKRDLHKTFRAVVTEAESDLSVLNSFQAAIGDGDPENIPSQILQNLFSGAGMPAVDNPGLVPDIGRGVLK